jgi:His-Xaa-Ser repeat protein HxsA
LTTLPGSTAKFTNIVLQVQTALYAYGYYAGPLTGVVDALTKAALLDMQAQFGLPATGTITPDTLDALSITAQ